MIEIPESATIGKQASETLKGKRIAHVIESNSPHRFTFYNGDPAEYSNRLGRTNGPRRPRLWRIRGHLYGRRYPPLNRRRNQYALLYLRRKGPKKYQLMIVFEDDSFLAFTVSMYGSIYAFKGEFDNPYYQGSIHKLCPLDERFDKTYFISLIGNLKKDISAKALLAPSNVFRAWATESAKISCSMPGSPRNEKYRLYAEEDIDRLFNTVKSTLEEMTRRGGRDTEKDLYGALGNYRTILSKNTYHDPCPVCGERIQKEAYLGGSIYYCPHCQRER